MIEEVRRVAKDRAADLTLDTSLSISGSIRSSGWRSRRRSKSGFGGRFPEDVMPELETCRQVLEAVEMYLGSGRRNRARQEAQAIPVRTTASTSSLSISS